MYSYVFVITVSLAQALLFFRDMIRFRLCRLHSVHVLIFKDKVPSLYFIVNLDHQMITGIRLLIQGFGKKRMKTVNDS